MKLNKLKIFYGFFPNTHSLFEENGKETFFNIKSFLFCLFVCSSLVNVKFNRILIQLFNSGIFYPTGP